MGRPAYEIQKARAILDEWLRDAERKLPCDAPIGVGEAVRVLVEKGIPTNRSTLSKYGLTKQFDDARKQQKKSATYMGLNDQGKTYRNDLDRHLEANRVLTTRNRALLAMIAEAEINAPGLGVNPNLLWPRSNELLRHKADSELMEFLAGHSAYMRVTAKVEAGGWSLLRAVKPNPRPGVPTKVLAVKVAGGWRYPSMQVDKDGMPQEGLQEVLQAVWNANGWAMLEWLVTPNSLVQDKCPAAVLAEPALKQLLLDAATYHFCGQS